MEKQTGMTGEKKKLTAREQRRLSWWTEKKKTEEEGNEKGNEEGPPSPVKTHKGFVKSDNIKSDQKNSSSKKRKQKQNPPQGHELVTAKRPKIEGTKERPKAGKSKAGQYVVFIGNLPYDVTVSEITDHFRFAGTPLKVRLPTHKATKNPRGFGYVEFATAKEHMHALQMHHTQLRGRSINVEFTSPGSRNDKRLSHLKEKNAALQRFKTAPGIKL